MENTIKLEPEKWSHRYTHYLIAYAKTRVPHAIVQDLVQETYLAGLKSANSFESKAHERTWLTSILKHKIVDYYRKSSSKKAMVNEKVLLEADYSDLFGKELTNATLSKNCVESYYNLHELKSIINDGLSKLTNKEREVLTLRLNGFETTEICNFLNVTDNYCWVLMSTARKKMKEFLIDKWWNIT